MTTQPATGTRKFSATREAQLMILCAFIFAAWFKADFELLGIAVAGISGNLGWFSWANVKVHASTSVEKL